MKVYLVIDECGSHEPDAVFSAWDSIAGAEAEIVRFREANGAWPNLRITEVEVNKPNDEWVNG